jgi:transcriptional regulator with XRE-family HTH domain
MKDFRTDLGHFMETAGVSQVELSKISGVSQSALSKFLSGASGDMRLTNAMRLFPIVYGESTGPDAPPSASSPSSCQPAFRHPSPESLEEV